MCVLLSACGCITYLERHERVMQGCDLSCLLRNNMSKSLYYTFCMSEY